ncbi:MAG: acyl-ACP--UDP-N-acetylglucosamine O-acyltransferase [Thermotogae bacterium]|nr:acyl-ACP--UDP-N-acetylglucosamine O-acyltransferase [Thermotogota bacterium]
MKVHPTAIFEGRVELDEGVEIGPYVFISGNVRIGKNTRIGAYVHITGKVKIGANNRIHHSVSIGDPPQDAAYGGEDTEVVIGDHNTIREFVTIHRATGEGSRTVLGDGNFLMAYVHIAHNCEVADGVVIANAAQLAGHVRVERRAFVSGVLGIHQWARVGEFAMVGGMTRLNRDAPPYFTTVGYDPLVVGLNLVGLRRAGFTKDEISNLKEAYDLIYRSDLPLEKALEELKRKFPDDPHISHLVEFFRTTLRGVILKSPKRS